jgi:hypothetical protein
MSQLLLPYPLVIKVPCRTSAEPGALATSHLITLEADGVVTTPHGLDTERIAAALGGYLSCLDLVDKAVPAFHDWVARHLRHHPRPIVTNDHGVTWSPEVSRPCCRWNGYVKPVDAARHARESVHVAALHDADQHQLRALIKGASIPDLPEPHGQIEARLWDCGIDPARAAAMREQLPDGFRPPMEFYLAAIATDVDLEWVGRTLAQTHPEPQLATWLAWTYADDDRRDPALRARWLQLGATPWAILALTRGGYRTHDITRLAESWRLSTTAIAQFLADWIEHGYNPDPAALLRDRFPDLPIPPRAPAANSITRLRSALGACSRRSTDTELALHLVTHGTVAHTVRALNLSGYTAHRPTSRKKTS